MRRTCSFLAILIILACVVALAQQPQPMPTIVVTAQTVYVTSYDGPSWAANVKQDDKRAVGDVITALQKWGRYQVVFDPARADIIIAVQKRPNSDTFAVYQGRLLPGAKSIPLWREERTGGLDSKELPMFAKFQTAVEAGEKK